MEQGKGGVEMRWLSDEGMTLLEVVFAISILLIGVSFIAKSDSVMYHYRNQHELRQQMLFYAAGQLEIVLQNQPAIQGKDLAENSPFAGFQVDTITSDLDPVNAHLELVGVAVSIPQATNPPDKVALYSYRVKK